MSADSLEVKVALLEQANESLKDELKELKDELKELRKDNDALKAMTTRWKGFGAALMALGGAAGFVFSQFDNLKALLGFAAKATH